MQETIDVIDDLQDSIGNWHDDIVSFMLLSSFVDKNKNIIPEKLNKYKNLIRNLS
jgi:CHAD domain-containing protein